MRIAALFSVALLLGTPSTQVRAGDPHWSRVRAEQLDSWPNQLLRIGGYGMVSRAEILRLKVENMKLSKAPEDSTKAMQARYLQARRDLDAYLAAQRWVD